MFSDLMLKVKAQEVLKNRVDLLAAIATDDLEALLKAFLRDQPMNFKDPKGNNLLHLAVMKGNRTMCRGICKVASTLELWKEKNSDGKTPIDIAKDAVIRRDLYAISTPRTVVNTYHTTFNKVLTEKMIKESKDSHKVLLSLDGGGVRVVLQTTILMEIERQLGEPIHTRIHWIGGTSCGGIMAASLSSGISVSDALKVLLLTRKRVFCGNTNMYPKHNPDGVESVIKDVLGTKTLMNSIKAHKVVVTSAKVQFAPPQLILFRTYAPRIKPKEFEQLGYLDPKKILLWKAIRCTSAAPLYFSSFNGMADGAIFFNNPGMMLMTEFFRLKKIENFHGLKNNDEIGCIVSIGTGTEPNTPIGGIDINVTNAFALTGNIREILANAKNLITLFLFQCTTSHNVHVGQCREWAHSLSIPYFRFSPKLSVNFELDNCKTDMLFDRWFELEVYLRTQAQNEIHDLCRLLKALPKNTEPCDYKKTARWK